VQTELEVECLASQLPEFLTIDLGDLVKGQSLHVSDLKLPEGIKAVKHGTLNPVIVSVSTRRKRKKKWPRWWSLPQAPGKAKKNEKQNKK
jgi:large subunit ribosomal protein L25